MVHNLYFCTKEKIGYFTLMIIIMNRLYNYQRKTWQGNISVSIIFDKHLQQTYRMTKCTLIIFSWCSAAQNSVSRCIVPYNASYDSGRGQQHVQKLVVGVSKGMQPERHSNESLLITVKHCGEINTATKLREIWSAPLVRDMTRFKTLVSASLFIQLIRQTMQSKEA